MRHSTDQRSVRVGGFLAARVAPGTLPPTPNQEIGMSLPLFFFMLIGLALRGGFFGWAF